MDRDELIKALRKEERLHNGEILDVDVYGVLYYDNENAETYYRFTNGCADEVVKDEIYISEDIKNNGFTKDYIISILREAYGNDYEEAISTLSGIIVVNNEDDYIRFLDEIETNTSDELNEWYSYDDLEDMCGMFLANFKIVVINEDVVRKTAHEIGIDSADATKEYEIGMIQSLIHEVRHCMMDSNMFLSEEKYPAALASEENVEQFCRDAYESLPYELLHFYMDEGLNYEEDACLEL